MGNADPASGSADTIAALATPAGRGGIGIIRVSGPMAGAVGRAVTGAVPPARRAIYCEARDSSGGLIDRGLALYFPAPGSYTGEDVFEFHGHGGPAVTGEVLRACLAAGARLAAAGEFTQRAYLNDKLDLAQAEAVADLIDAQSAEAARLAMRSLTGEFSAAIHDLVSRVTDLRALTEATLDFPEEDVDVLHTEDARTRLADLRERLAGVLRGSRQGRLLREGIRVVIAGRPNVGKSSLLNRLAGEDRAIVTAVPGTTRDVLRELIRIEGVPIHVVDTAGLRETADEVEKEGIARTWKAVGDADVLLAVVEEGEAPGPEDEAMLRRMPAGARRIRVLNKVDLVPGAVARVERTDGSSVHLSARTGEGIDLLRQAILEVAGARTGGESMFLARERHLQALGAASAHLDYAAAEEGRWELFAEELRLAQAALSSITGEFSADDLLGEIFSRFCIGK